MLTLEIICVGKMSASWFDQGVEEYAKRLTAYDKVAITELPEYKTNKDNDAARAEAIKKEGELILKRIAASGKALKVAMCIEGKQYSSEDLAQLIQTSKQHYSKILFIIGGSAGLSDEVKRIADVRFSMSRMTFPHQMARMILMEQLYRAESINNGGKYHK